MTRKQLIILFGGTVGLLLIFVIFLGVQEFSQKPTPATVTNVTAGQKGETQVTKTNTATSGKKVLTPTPLPVQMTAPQMVQNFYFATMRGNSLANGGFENNQYLTGAFKDNIREFYDNGNKPVFCPKNRRTQVAVGKEQKRYYAQEYLTQEFISDATNGKDLYLVTLQSRNNEWQIFDIVCL